MANMVLEIGTNRLVIDPDTITLRKVKALAFAIDEVRAKHSVFREYPMLDKESLEAYRERVSKLLLEKNDKKDDEDAETFLKRIYESKLETQSMLYDQLKAIADQFGQGNKVTEDAWEETPYLGAKNFVSAVLEHCDLV